MVVDPVGWVLTHLVVEPRHERATGRLVPVSLVESAAKEIRLRRQEHEAVFAGPLRRVSVADEEESAEAVRRTTELTELDKQLAVAEKSLRHEGVGLEQLEREIEDEVDPDVLAASLAELSGTISQIEGDHNKAVERLTIAKSELDRMDIAAMAAEAVDAVEQELAAISRHPQDYLRLRLAKIAVGACGVVVGEVGGQDGA